MVLDNRIALDYLLAEQEGVCAIAIPPAVPGSTFLVLQQIQEINKQATWLKQVDAPSGTFFDLFDTNWFGSQRSWLRSILQLFGIIFLIVIIVVSQMHCVFSVVLNATAISSTSDGLTVLGETETK